MRPDPASSERLRQRTELIISYLERLSADSAWAHRASGLRGALWLALETPPEAWHEPFLAELQALVDRAFWMLKEAAMEIPDPEGHF
jgi:hypothetical protein